jgi:1-acyl-sn-glycerol-3-phosphate acyltransferase
MIRTIFAFAIVIGSLILSIFAALLYYIIGIFSKKAQQSFMISITTGWACACIWGTGTKLKIEGVEKVPDAPVLYVANHESYFDIVAMMFATPHFTPLVSKVELLKVPMLAFWMKKMGCLFMDRSNMRQSLKVILAGIELLKSGESLVIFPEGTRSKSNKVHEFKKGSLKLATKAKVPIVPVTLVNTAQVYEVDGKVHAVDAKVIFHDPIDSTTLSKEEQGELHDTVRNIIIEPIAKYQ